MKKLVKYSENCTKRINRILKKPSTQYTEETFHELRIVIKKLRFIYDLGKFSNRKVKAIEFSKAFDGIFKRAGKVRDVQIKMTSLNDFTEKKLFKGFHLLLEEELKKANKKFYYDLKQIDKRLMQKIIKGFQTLSKSISNKDIEEYIKGQKKIIKKQVKSQNLEKVLHDIRKHLKKIGYAEKVINRNTGKSKFDSLSLLLGRWHDNRVVLDQIRKMMKTGTKNEKEKTLLMKIMDELKKMDESFFDKIKPRVYMFE